MRKYYDFAGGLEGGGQSKRIIPIGNYFVAQCEKCGFKGTSDEWLGGRQIADTGDYGDCYCPICGEIDVEEAEDVLYVDQRDFFIQKIKELNEQISELTWQCHAKKKEPGLMEVLDVLRAQIAVYTGLCYRFEKEDRDKYLNMPSYLKANEIFDDLESLPADKATEPVYPRWVKCFERLPTKFGVEGPIFREIGTKKVFGYAEKREDQDYIDSLVFKHSPFKNGVVSQEGDPLLHYEELEWLEESPSNPIQGSSSQTDK